ncbi:transglutaminaseTgpA domain-containing protein [Saccharomonospora sp. NPDC006951]
MTTYPPAPPAAPPSPAPRPPAEAPSSNGFGTLLSPAVAGLATVSAATSLTGVVQGMAWLGYIVVATVLVACTGVALRSLRVPVVLVGLAQLFVLLCLVVGVFTRSGILAIFPGPAAFSELNDVLIAAFDEIRTGLPPVEGSTPILCLVTIAIGLVAVVVDALAVGASAPAATGLVLLCVYAVPSALAGELLPWWTFALGAASFAGLLAVDGSHRHRRWRNRSTPGLGASPGTVSAPIAVVSAALVVGLVAGSTVTVIGTEGSLPGSADNGQNVPGGLGVNPFTSLRGMLDQGADVELFRVTGLGDERRLLRAFTLDTYRPNEGWGLADGPMPAGVPATGPLPAAPGDDGSGESREIRIQPVNWYDLWLPTYGSPRSLRGLSDGWYYDHTSGTVFRERRQRPAPYVEVTSLEEPSKAELRIADSQADPVPEVYSSIEGVDPRVAQLARDLTEGATNDFDRAQAIWQYFSPENGFVYDTSTAPATDPDAVADFVLNGKRGFCEQYASSMAVMLRSLGVPTRVAIGFTTGYPTSDYRTITSQDAHAWVEVYFGDKGWVSFDPTPLSDGRGYVPPYLEDENTSSEPTSQPEESAPTAPSSSQAAPSPTEQAAGQEGGPVPPRQGFTDAPSWSGWSALVTGLAALVLTLVAMTLGKRFAAGRRRDAAGSGPPRWLTPLAGALWLLTLLLLAWQLHWAVALVLLGVAAAGLAPSALREFLRRRRLRSISARGPAAATAAWDELLDECADRGVHIPESDTVRLAAQKIAHRHHLDDRGKNDLRTVVDVVERSWYGSAGAAPEGSGFADAFAGLRDGLQRTAPKSWRSRLLPRSLFRRR